MNVCDAKQSNINIIACFQKRKKRDSAPQSGFRSSKKREQVCLKNDDERMRISTIKVQIFLNKLKWILEKLLRQVILPIEFIADDKLIRIYLFYFFKFSHTGSPSTLKSYRINQNVIILLKNYLKFKSLPSGNLNLYYIPVRKHYPKKFRTT